MSQHNKNKCEIELLRFEIEFKFISLPQAAHSVKDVQVACNCDVSEVIKTLLMIVDGNIPVMVLLPGNKRANLEKVKKSLEGTTIRMATPQEVLSLTGYKVGSVSPFGVPTEIRQLADQMILQLENLFLGSGQDNIILKLPIISFSKSFQGNFHLLGD